MDMIDQFVVINGLRIHYLSAGSEGSPVLLLHGGGTDSARLSWGEVIGPLAESGHRVIAPDFPGSGDSDRPDIPYNTDFFVGFTASLIDALGLDQPSLVGLSMGGAICLGTTLALQDASPKRSNRVSRLVLVDSYGIQRKVAMHFVSWLSVKTPGIMEGTWALARSSPATARWLMQSIFYDPRAVTDSLMDEVAAESAKPFTNRAFTRYQRSEMFWNSLRTVYLDRLGEIQSPALIIHGRNDTGVPLACAEEAHRLIPGSQLHIIDQAGHWAQREKPAEFIQAVTGFLKDDPY